MEFQYIRLKTGEVLTSEEVLGKMLRRLHGLVGAIWDFNNPKVRVKFQDEIQKMIKEDGYQRQKVSFVAKDGTRFEDKDKALQYEQMLPSIHKAVSLLDKRHPGVTRGLGWQQHSRYIVNEVQQKVLSILEKYDPQHPLLQMKNPVTTNARDAVIEGGVKHRRFLMQLKKEGKISPYLFNIFYRFICTNNKGQEFGQPYEVSISPRPRHTEQTFPIQRAAPMKRCGEWGIPLMAAA